MTDLSIYINLFAHILEKNIFSSVSSIEFIVSMEQKQSAPRSNFADINEVVPEEDAEQEPQQQDKNKRFSSNRGPNRGRQRPYRGFSRQVSLETGFSVLNRESKGRGEKKSLPRSGRSFAGFETRGIVNGGGDGRKGDFSIFRTKSTLSKQNSLLPSVIRERDIENSLRGEDGETKDESINENVSAGRYFAALRGPELDEVKVTTPSSSSLFEALIS